jgi:alpha-tubulin suppressor-like RCC1 family protein
MVKDVATTMNQPWLVAALVFRQVSAGGGHSCGVTTDDQAYCWGSNAYGNLGDGTHTPSSVNVWQMGVELTVH